MDIHGQAGDFGKKVRIKPMNVWRFIKETMANSADLDQTPQNVASDQGLHCFNEYKNLGIKRR